MPEQQKKAGRPVTDEIAAASKDIDIFAGWINRLENPDRTLRTEAQGKGLKLYDEVDRDPHAGAVLQTRYLSVIGKEWEVLPGEEPSAKGRPATVTRAQKIADFVREVLLDTNFDQSRQELLQGILYGFYVAEVIWQVKDNAVLPRTMLAKHPRRFSFTMDRELRLLTRSNMVEGEPVPDRKFICFTYGSSDNPYGRGLGQKLWWPVWFKKNGIKFWLIFLEKYGMPTAVGKYPSGTPPEQQQELLDAIEAIQNETGIKIPEGMAIDLLEATRQGKVTYETLCEYMDKQVSKAVLGQTATTEGTPGKLGNEEAQGEVRQDILKADADLLCECLNDTLIKWIVDYNFPGVTDYPKLWIRTEAEKDLKALAERDKTLTKDIGVPVGKRYFYETYAIPEPEEEEELVSPQGTGAGEQVPGEFVELKSTPFSQDDLDNMSDQATKKAQDHMSQLLESAMDLIEGATSYKEIGEKLYGLYPNIDTAEFQELLARAIFASGLTGYAAAETDEQ